MQQKEVLPEYQRCVEEYGIAMEECRCFSFEAGEMLLSQGSKVDSLYFIISGIARVVVCNEEGKILSLSYSHAEGVLGEVELMNQEETATTSVIAETRLLCLVFPYEKARSKCETDLHFINRVAKDLAAKLSRSTGSFLSASFASAENRVCTYLMKEARQNVYRGTLAKASEATGVSYRHIQRVMIHLCNANILSKEKDGYHILDLEELMKRACA